MERTIKRIIPLLVLASLSAACHDDEATAPTQITDAGPVFSLMGSSGYPEGMVSYWKLEEGDGVTAFDVVDGRDGTLEPATDPPVWTSGRVGGALSFDGSNDYVLGQIGTEEEFRVRTVEAWVKLNSYPTGNRYGIVAAAIGGSHPGENACHFSEILEVDRNGRASYYNWSGNHIVRPSGPTVLELNEWYHLAATITPDGSGYWVKLYVNGEPGTPLWSTYGPNWDHYFLFSFRNRCWGYAWDHDRFDGVIDEVAFYDRALTSGQVQVHYENGLHGLGYDGRVQIDIKPGSDPNSINLGSNGTVPVAIFSTADFDATSVDPTSVTLADAEVKVKGNGTPMASEQDVNQDGLTDLVVHVSTSGLALTDGDVEAVLEGETFDGLRIQGSDFVRIVP
jgi:hypothetical protein